MKYVLAGLVLLVACSFVGCSPGGCCDLPQTILKGGDDGFGVWINDRQLDFSRRADGILEVRSHELGPIRERVIELPEDGSVWHTIAIYPSTNFQDSPSRTLAANLASTPRLQSLLAQTKKHTYTPADPWVRRWLPGVATPSLILMRHDGKAIYKASGANLPPDGEQIADDIQLCINERRWIQSVGNCTPDNCPNRDFERPRILDKIPDLGPRNPGVLPAGLDEPLLLLLAAGGVMLLVVWLARRR